MTQFNENMLIPEAESGDTEVFDIREYWYIISKHKKGILSFTLIFSALAILVLFNMAPQYKATTVLLVEADTSSVLTSVPQVYDFGMGKSQYYATQFTILSNTGLVRKVIGRNQKEFEAYFDSEYPKSIKGMLEHIIPMKESKQDRMVDFFIKNLDLQPQSDTQLVNINYECKNAVLGAKLANDLAQVYIEDNLDASFNKTKEASDWLVAKIDTLRAKETEAEQRLQTYRDSADIVDISGVSTMVEREMEQTAVKLADAREARTQAENIASQVDKLPDHSIESLSSIAAVLQDPLVQKLLDEEGAAQQNLSELTKRYGEQHPKIIAAKSDMEVSRKNTGNQILKVIDGIHKQYEVAKATEAALTKQMAELKERAQDLNRKQSRLDQLQREVDANRQLFDTFFSRVKETAEFKDSVTSNARIVDPAVPPTDPDKPKVFILAPLSIVVGFVMGIFLAFFRESIDNTVRTRDDVLLKLHTQFLGVLPLLKTKDKTDNACLEFASNGQGAFSESIRTIRTGVVLSGIDNPHKILVVTSSIPNEGKTTVSANLATAFGQMGKTLLIDADMRRPTIAKKFGIPLSAPGLSNLVAETAEPKDCIRRIESIGVDVITAGMVPPNPLELLSSRRFAAVLAGLEKHYDRIIIDSAPSEVVSDALILSTYASAVIYVVKADSTVIKAVRSGITRLREAKAPLTGIVLNQVDIEKTAKYGGGYYGQYYGGYYDYYGYSSSTPKIGETTTD